MKSIGGGASNVYKYAFIYFILMFDCLNLFDKRFIHIKLNLYWFECMKYCLLYNSCLGSTASRRPIEQKATLACIGAQPLIFYSSLQKRPLS